MEALLPSEIARLVWGYLQAECPSAGHVFLKNCPALSECREAKRLGRRLLDTVNGHTLLDLLSDISDTFNLVSETIQNYPQEVQSEIKNKLSLSNKVQALVKHLSATTPALITAPPVSKQNDVPVAPPVEEEERCVSPVETMVDSAEDILAASPMRALISNLASKLRQHKTNVPFKKRKMTDSPSMNMEGTSDDSGMAPADMDPEAIFMPIFKNTQFHEKIAASINKILHPKKNCDELLNKDLDQAIQQVVSETEKDPNFEDIIQEMCQVTSQAALSEGDLDDTGFGPVLSPPVMECEIEINDAASQRTELHTPDPTDEASTDSTPSRGRRTRLKGTPSRSEGGEVPLKARLRSASKVGAREDDVLPDCLLLKQNEEAIRSIVEAMPEIDLLPSPQPEAPSGTQQMDNVTLEISLSEEEQRRVTVFNQPVSLSSLGSIPEQTGMAHIPLHIPAQALVPAPALMHTSTAPAPSANDPPAPILPPVRLHPNPPLPASAPGSVIIIMDQSDMMSNTGAVPTGNLFAQQMLPLAPRGPLPEKITKRFCTNIKKRVADRNINAPAPRVRKDKTEKIPPPSDLPTPIITMDGLIVHPGTPLPGVEPQQIHITTMPTPPAPVFAPPAPAPPAATVPMSPAIIPPSPMPPPSPAFIPPTPSPIAAPHPGFPQSQMSFVSMPSISPAQQVASASASTSTKSPVAAESSAERPIEARKSFSTPRRDSSYVRTLNFSTPEHNKVAARRALTSPKVNKPRGLSSAKQLSTAARIVRNRLFDKSPDLKNKKSPKNRLSLIREEPVVEQAPVLPPPIEESAIVIEASPEKEPANKTSPPKESAQKVVTPEQPAANQSAKKSSDGDSWDAKLRAAVGFTEPSPVKRSPRKRHRIGGTPKTTESSSKAKSPKKKTPEPPAQKKSTKDITSPKTKGKKTPSKGAGKRGRAALRPLNAARQTTPPPDKERLLESLQLSPLRQAPRLPEPTFSMNSERMTLITCEWSGAAAIPEQNLEPVDRDYVMTISVETDEGDEAEINLAWTATDTWQSGAGRVEEYLEEDEPPRKRARQEESISLEDDDLMTYALVGSIRSENSPSPVKGMSRNKARSPGESANPQDMLRKVGVDNLLSALHGKTKK